MAEEEVVAGPLSLDDVPALLGLFHDYDRRFFGEPLMDADDLHSDLAAPDVDLAVDSLSLRTPGDGRLVGGGYLLPSGHLEAQLAGGWEHLRARLVDFGESRARVRGLDAVYAFLADADHDGATWLLARGYRLSYTAWILRLGPETPITGRTLPPGYAVRPFALADAEVAYTVIRDAFGEWDTRPERGFASWRAQTLERPHVDPSAFRVATCAGEVIGACTVFDSDGEAWVAQLAVTREHRGRGVAQQLLAEAYAAARARGVPQAGLSTDTRTGALDLYLRLGMRVRHTLDSYTNTLA